MEVFKTCQIIGDFSFVDLEQSKGHKLHFQNVWTLSIMFFETYSNQNQLLCRKFMIVTESKCLAGQSIKLEGNGCPNQDLYCSLKHQ
jgi:hypothetical protein